jgi:hypothetical protein
MVDRRCIVTQMTKSHVQEIICRYWPGLQPGRFVTVGSLSELGRGHADRCDPSQSAESPCGDIEILLIQLDAHEPPP